MYSFSVLSPPSLLSCARTSASLEQLFSLPPGSEVKIQMQIGGTPIQTTVKAWDVGASWSLRADSETECRWWGTVGMGQGSENGRGGSRGNRSSGKGTAKERGQEKTVLPISQVF